MKQESGMTPMLEKVARDVNDEMPKLGKWETLTPEMKAECIDVVRRVVRALREPDEEMMLAFDCAAVFNGDAMFSEEWAKAIDSILADTGDGE